MPDTARPGDHMRKAFWVNQGGTYLAERKAGLLWAPERTVKGGERAHWESMSDVQPGDVVFTYSNSHLRGYAIATTAAVSMERPYDVGHAYTSIQGGRVVFCTYHVLTAPVRLAALTANPLLLAELRSGRNAVLDVRGRVSQKYLCQISPLAADLLASAVGIKVGHIGKSAQPLSATTVRRLVDARLGQGKFRDDLMTAYGETCPVTSLAIRPLLRASHIKPWTSSNNDERLDPENGILLAAGVDAAFDKGFFSFNDQGLLLSKPVIGPIERAALGVPLSAVSLSSAFLTPARRDYLAIHRTRFGH
ncbi:MAG: HNH endonuclease [Verrucomicrobiaceae bacterium]|nr:MAG: HNH endonuclease [Verrucomicrobiaceae bacterium]